MPGGKGRSPSAEATPPTTLRRCHPWLGCSIAIQARGTSAVHGQPPNALAQVSSCHHEDASNAGDNSAKIAQPAAQHLPESFSSRGSARALVLGRKLREAVRDSSEPVSVSTRRASARRFELRATEPGRQACGPHLGQVRKSAGLAADCENRRRLSPKVPMAWVAVPALAPWTLCPFRSSVTKFASMVMALPDVKLAP